MPIVAGTYIRPEMVLPIFLATAIIVVVLSFLVVLLVRSVPSKLILLGLFLMVGGICLGAINPLVATPVLVLVILAAILVLTGLLCILASFLVQLFVSAKTPAATP